MTTAQPAPRSTGTASRATRQKAGAFDLRNVIGALMGIYSIILLLSYFFLDPGINPETGALKNATDNLWMGLALLAASVIFLAWAKLRPIVIETPVEATSADTAAVQEKR